MEKMHSKIIGTTVFDDAAVPITSVKDLVLDPESGKIIAFVVDAHKRRVISPMDVLEWKVVLKIHNLDVIIDAEDILRVDEVMKKGTQLKSKKVETDKGKYLGKVSDYAVNTNTMDLRKIEVAKGFLGLIRYETRIIPVKEIVEVLPEKVVVKDDMKVIRTKASDDKVAAVDMAAA